MNFIAHYHFYRTEDPYYNTGLVLPDLVKAFCNSRYTLLPQYASPFYTALAEGTKCHLEADAIFHESDFFKESSEFIAGLLNEKAGWPRTWFFNHVLTEIMLDRAIMDRHADICNEFYRDLASVNGEKINLFLKISGVLNYQNFSEGLDRFVKIRFVSDYIHNEKIILALGRLYNRVGIRYDWTDEDRDLLMKHLPEIHTWIHLNVDKLKSALN